MHGERIPQNVLNYYLHLTQYVVPQLFQDNHGLKFLWFDLKKHKRCTTGGLDAATFLIL